MRFVYAAKLDQMAPDDVVVSFRDISECLTSGSNVAEALVEAADALEEAIAGRIDDGEPIPVPTGALPGEHEVPVPPMMASKAALAVAFRDSGLTLVSFAASLGIDEKAVGRMLDPRHETSPDRIGRALRPLGCRIAVQMDAA